MGRHPPHGAPRSSSSAPARLLSSFIHVFFLPYDFFRLARGWRVCPTVWLLAGGSQVHNRLNLALPFAVPRPVAALALVAASLTQIASAGVFISGYGGRAYERAVPPAPSLRVP
jgi:hypothetical protein